MEVQPEDYIKIIAPPPVVLVSTLYSSVKNIAPFGMVMPISHNPPMIALGIFERWDTFQNIIETQDFVVAYPTPDLIKQIETAAERWPRNISEFEKAGLTPIRSKLVQPFRVKECQVNLECQLEWCKPAGDHHIVVGKIVAAYITDALWKDELYRAMIDPVYDAGGKEQLYARKGKLLKYNNNHEHWRNALCI
jgi:flavin reductase (DIM6/NTAB) family NADH-FMN oxidoreductase RutF